MSKYYRKGRMILRRFYIVQSITKSILLLILHSKKHRAFESLFDSDSDFLLRCNDEDWTEYDEREAEPVLDKDVMELVLVSVSQHQVDVIVGEVDQDQAGQQQERAGRYSSGSPARGEGQTEQADDEGDEGSQDGGNVD